MTLRKSRTNVGSTNRPKTSFEKNAGKPKKPKRRLLPQLEEVRPKAQGSKPGAGGKRGGMSSQEKRQALRNEREAAWQRKRQAEKQRKREAHKSKFIADDLQTLNPAGLKTLEDLKNRINPTHDASAWSQFMTLREMCGSTDAVTLNQVWALPGPPAVLSHARARAAPHARARALHATFKLCVVWGGGVCAVYAQFESALHKSGFDKSSGDAKRLYDIFDRDQVPSHAPSHAPSHVPSHAPPPSAASHPLHGRAPLPERHAGLRRVHEVLQP